MGSDASFDFGNTGTFTIILPAYSFTSESGVFWLGGSGTGNPKLFACGLVRRDWQPPPAHYPANRWTFHPHITFRRGRRLLVRQPATPGRKPRASRGTAQDTAGASAI